MPQDVTVAYLGPPASYSHQAALGAFDTEEHTFIPQTTIGDIFTSVQTGATTYGVVPFENSTNGNVVFTLDLFRDRSSGYHVVGETYLTVHHSLVSSASDLTGLTRLYSHPQAFGQCEHWLNSTLKGIERIDVSSTSRAAQLVRDEPGSAAIASAAAAEVNGLKVLARNIEDTPDNTTRFFVLQAAEMRSPMSEEGGKGDKTFVAFSVDHAQPGALADGLKVFKNFGLNLTSIASRPDRKTRWNYVFFVEFEGHEDTQNVKDALEELGTFCAEMRVLGSYVDRQKLAKKPAAAS
ncbi:Prephenate dehydratase-domain-containing protein [Tricharina praecox]|uniref:Prephenate dehydratase-domain-containing protein n=1 Tax=Tricharina praecox TaxID=43433 RepID=UPI00221E69E5|nr:Prephenate dehydratase-domain-containing protein [Tricharina praecox]KAI5851871.1 Prephenate dehydratase-domain-containing protein [Tricharina praecox]